MLHSGSVATDGSGERAAMAAAVEIIEETALKAPPLRAAQYVRMSTDHQRYSTENQGDAIAAYAAIHNMEIVATYADEGKSGLNIGGREGLQRLIADIDAGRAVFEVLLVYDVSRWGRFQDADES